MYQEKMREMLDIAASQVDTNVRRQVNGYSGTAVDQETGEGIFRQDKWILVPMLGDR
jgi:hypothetical protein